MPSWQYIPDRVEFVCEHGVGHPPCWSRFSVHGCDGCCGSGHFPGRKPSVGDLALCGHGSLGVITDAKKRMIVYPDGGRGFAWSGRHLSDVLERAKPGDLWSSRNPCIVGNLLYLPTDVSLDWAVHIWDLVAQNPVRDWPRLIPEKIPLAQRKGMSNTIRQEVNETIMRVLREMP